MLNSIKSDQTHGRPEGVFHLVPELPEVETVARQLAPLLQGCHIHHVQVNDAARIQLGHPEALQGRRIGGVSRLGKQVVLSLIDSRHPDRPLWLCVHLRMTGRLIWSVSPDPVTGPLPRVLFTLDQGFLLFQDTRRFGTLKLISSLAEAQPTGLDPFDEAFCSKRLSSMAADCRQELKPWLLRQDRLVGMGNIYASEALHEARLSPRRLAGSLTPDEAGRLCRAIRKILKQAITHGGTSFSDYQDARGNDGGFQKRLRVYARAGQACSCCGDMIERIVQQGRSTFYCPGCQGKHTHHD